MPMRGVAGIAMPTGNAISANILTGLRLTFPKKKTILNSSFSLPE